MRGATYPWGMFTGLLALLVVLAITAAIAVVYQRKNGRFADQPGASTSLDPTRASVGPAAATPPRDRSLSAEDIGVALGVHATLVQFSTVFCAPCRSARTLLSSVADRRDGVSYVDVDAESHLDLVRALNVMRTPTIFVLDAAGSVVNRASGLPRRTDVESVLDQVQPIDM